MLEVIWVDSEGTLKKKLQTALVLSCPVHSSDTENMMEGEVFTRRLVYLWLRLFCKMSFGDYSESNMSHRIDGETLCTFLHTRMTY